MSLKPSQAFFNCSLRCGLCIRGIRPTWVWNVCLGPHPRGMDSRIGLSPTTPSLTDTCSGSRKQWYRLTLPTVMGMLMLKAVSLYCLNTEVLGIFSCILSPQLGYKLWRREWLPTSVFLTGESDRGAWLATAHRVTESDTTEQHTHTGYKLRSHNLQVLFYHNSHSIITLILSSSMVLVTFQHLQRLNYI